GGHGQSLDQLKRHYWRQNPSKSGEEGVDRHVVCHAFRRSEFRHPETPGYIPASGGEAEDDCAPHESSQAFAGEKSQDADPEPDVDGHSEREEVHPVKQPSPDWADHEPRNVGNDPSQQSDQTSA